MKTSLKGSIGRSSLTLAVTLAVQAALSVAPAQAQTTAPMKIAQPYARPQSHAKARAVAGRVLTVHRRPVLYARGYGFGQAYGDGYAVPGLVRRWNDPNLYSFGGWRFGGDSFYGDQAGDTITRGNTALGAISGYGAARGGYGGPHFDAVGGFHKGPGPDAQEAADYATGSISTPAYDRPMPHYPSVKARVAALNTGVASGVAARFTRTKVESGSTPSEPRYLRQDALFPDFGIDAF